MIRPLDRDDMFSAMRRGYLRDGILEYVGRNPRRRRREIVSQFSYRYWVCDIDDMLDSLLEDGSLRIVQDGVWDVIVAGGED